MFLRSADDIHKNILDLMIALNYQIDLDGACFGISHMIKQALLCGECNRYNDRLHYITSMPVDNLIALHTQRKKEWLLIQKQIKADGEKAYRHLSDLDKILLEGDSRVIAAMKKLASLNLSTEAFRRRKERFIYNLYIQENLHYAFTNKISYHDQLLLEMEAFFDGIMLYQNLHLLLKIYSGPIKVQDEILSIQFTSPANAQDIYKEDNIITGAYSEDELLMFCTSLFTSIIQTNVKEYVCFVLRGGDHTICFGYDKKLQKWIFSNAAYVEVIDINNVKEISKKIFNAMTDNDHAIFSTEIYGNQSAKHLIMNCITHWKQQKEYQQIHAVIPQKVELMDSNKLTWLFCAVLVNDITTATMLIANGANVKNLFGGKSLLFIAAQNGYLEMVRFLLKSIKPKFDINAIMIATSVRQTKVIELLLDSGADVNTVQNNKTPLIIAANNNDLDSLQCLLRYGADPNFFSSTEDSPLYKAIKNNNINMVILLIQSHANPNLYDKEGYSLLFIAVGAHQYDIVDLLLKNQLDVNVQTESMTPLRAATRGNDVKMVQLLLKYRANPNLADDREETPLFIASQYGNVEIMALLLAANSTHDHNLNGDTPLFAAVKNRQLAAVDFLLSYDFVSEDWNLPNNQGLTPLLQAIINGDLAILKTILQKGFELGELKRIKKKEINKAFEYANENPQIIALLNYYNIQNRAINNRTLSQIEKGEKRNRSVQSTGFFDGNSSKQEDSILTRTRSRGYTCLEKA